MSVRIAICVAVLAIGAGWLGVKAAQSTQQVTSTEPAAPQVPNRQVVTADGYIYVSGIAPASPLIDINEQTASVLSQLKTLLEANGSSLPQLCSVQVTLKSAADFDAMNAVYSSVLNTAPPTRTTFVSWLRGSTLIEISAVAVPNGAHREALQPAGWAKTSRPYSYIVKTDDLVFFSGLTSRRGMDDAVMKGSVKTQTQVILDNAGALLETAGLTYDDIVSARAYLTSPYDFPDFNEMYGNYFTKAAPARATAVVELMSADANVEITMVASQRPKSVIGGQAANGLPVSLAIQAGPRVWFSAVIGDTEKHAGKIEEQTRDAFDHLRATLALAGMKFSDVIDTAVYMPDTLKQSEIDVVFKDIFKKDPPARTVVGARLVVDPALVEILALAVKK